MKYDAKIISRENFEDIINFSADAIIALDEARDIILFNKAAQDLFGYSDTEILGQSLDILLPTKVRPRHDEYIDDFDHRPQRARSMTNRSTVQGLTKSNQNIPLDISIQKHPKGSALRYSAVIRDMSSHIESLEILEKSEERLSRAQRIAHIGHWEWNILTGDLIWSDEIYRIFGQKMGVYEASYENFLNVIHPEDRSNVADYVAWCVEHKMPYAIIHRIICPDEEEKVVREKGEIYCDDEGTAVRMDGTVQDITESSIKEEQLRLMSEQAQAANRAKSQFLATMSHELRTPLNAIIGMSTMMEEETLGPILPTKYGEYITDIKNSGYNLLGHINNILDISNVEMENINTAAVEVNATDLIETCLQIIAPIAQDKKIHIETDISETLVDICVDSSHCKKILVNLLSNAIKFSEKGGRVILGLHEAAAEENIVFTVQDFGIGIAQDDMADLFKPFTQVDMDLSRSHEGAGLGLSVVKALTEIQGGYVTFESAVDKGTLVSVILPNTAPDSDSRWI